MYFMRFFHYYFNEHLFLKNGLFGEKWLQINNVLRVDIENHMWDLMQEKRKGKFKVSSVQIFEIRVQCVVVYVHLDQTLQKKMSKSNVKMSLS